MVENRSMLAKAQARLSSLVGTIFPADALTEHKFPAFDDLPLVDGQPKGCLWGFFDRNGKKDEAGTINLLTTSVVREAAAEIRTGQRVQLDRVMEHDQNNGFAGRKAFEQKVLDFSDNSPIYGFDDEVHFNTQGSSQWDGLKHFAHQANRVYYNGLSHQVAKQSCTNGTHIWGEHGGIVGRGILVDWARWHEHMRGALPAPNLRHEIPASELEETLKWQGTITRQGDILIVRSGYGQYLDKTGDPATRTIGVQANEVTMRWLYDKHFSAVAGDTLAFEAWPPRLKTGWCLHEWLLAQWGTPIGELWDLEELSRRCEKEQRWSFFLTSAPLRVKGGIGSPPNVIATL